MSIYLRHNQALDWDSTFFTCVATHDDANIMRFFFIISYQAFWQSRTIFHIEVIQVMKWINSLFVGENFFTLNWKLFLFLTHHTVVTMNKILHYFLFFFKVCWCLVYINSYHKKILLPPQPPLSSFMHVKNFISIFLFHIGTFYFSFAFFHSRFKTTWDFYFICIK